MVDPNDGRPLAARVYALGILLKKSAAESYRNSLNLGSTEWPLVVSLTHGPSSLAKLCERLSRDKGQVSRDIAALAARGLLVKVKDPHDNRQVVIDINREDNALMAEVARITEERHLFLTAGLSGAEQDQLLSLISKIYENARNPKIFEI